MIMDTTQTAKGKRGTEQVMVRTRSVGRGAELPCPLQIHHPPSTSMHSLTWNLSKLCCLNFFMAISLHRHDWLNHWSLGTESISSPSTLVGGFGAESSNPLIIPWHFPQPPLKLFWNHLDKSYLLAYQHTKGAFIAPEITDFRSSVPETWTKTKF